jgi:hypothetical protein
MKWAFESELRVELVRRGFIVKGTASGIFQRTLRWTQNKPENGAVSGK